MEAAECGAASLAIILGHFGRFIPLEELRTACGVSRDGSKASSIVKVAQQHGLTAEGFRRPSNDVLAGPFPAIAFWNFNHFLVIEGAKGKRVYLNDPATGPRAVSRDEFDANYSGILLTFEKTPEFRPEGSPPRLLPRMLAQLRDYRRQVAFVLLVGLLMAIPAFLVPGFTTIFVDDILIRQQTGWLSPTLLVLSGVIILLAMLAWLKETTLIRMEAAMALSRSAEFLWHVLRLPAGFFAQRHLGDIAQRTVSVEALARVVTADLGGAFIGALTAAALFAMMTMLDPVLAALSAGGALVNVLVLRMVHRARTDVAIRLQTEQGKLFANSVIGIRAIETLKATGGEDEFFAKWAGFHARCINSEATLARLEQSSLVAPPLIATLTTALALWIGGGRVMEGVLTLGSLLAYQALFLAATAPVQQMVDAAGKTQQTSADLARLDDVFRHPLDWRHASTGSIAADHGAHPGIGLELRDLSFGYNPLEKPLIDGLNLSVAPGGWVALVGSSGSGKSTVGKLIGGLYPPRSGEVLIDGRPIGTFDRHDLARLIAMVDQDIVLFDGTIRENISLWDPDLGNDALLAAVRDAELFELISAMPGNLDGRVDESGRNLSGGQRQRIEIARGLARSPRLLVLDEATSALDPATELSVMQALRRRGMTCVVVAHRLSTIRDCDEIILLDQGRVAERGSHDTLMALGGAYASLIAGEDAS